MRIDTYTKAILTTIAGALVWIAAGGTNIVPTVEAQDRAPTRVIVVGWEPGGASGSRALPMPIQIAGWTDLRGGQYQLPQPYPIEAAREQGAGLPIHPDR